jgi:hypothetical protein
MNRSQINLSWTTGTYNSEFTIRKFVVLELPESVVTLTGRSHKFGLSAIINDS